MKKRYGLPYKGSKVRMLKQGFGAKLISLIKPETTTFVDLFCGGLSVSDYMDDNTDLCILSNDADPNTIDYLSRAINKNFDIKLLTREQAKTAEPFYRHIYSYRTIYGTYVYVKWIEPWALQAMDYYFNDAQLPPFPNGIDRKQKKALISKELHNKLTKHYNKQITYHVILDPIYRYESASNFQVNRISLSNTTYDKVAIPVNSLVYADPPYKGTSGYSLPFDSEAFWQWCREQPFPVYVSEMTAPDDFTSIWSKDFSDYTKNLKGNGDVRTEQLFVYNKFLSNDKLNSD